MPFCAFLLRKPVSALYFVAWVAFGTVSAIVFGIGYGLLLGCLSLMFALDFTVGGAIAGWRMGWAFGLAWGIVLAVLPDRYKRRPALTVILAFVGALVFPLWPALDSAFANMGSAGGITFLAVPGGLFGLTVGELIGQKATPGKPKPSRNGWTELEL